MESSELEMLESFFDDVESVYVDDKPYKPVFDYGTVEDLNKVLRVTRRGEVNRYPLIWLPTPFKVDYIDEFYTGGVIKLVLATNTSSTAFNKERSKTTVKKVLLPLIANITEAIKRSKFIFGSNKYDLVYHFNYNVDEAKSTDIWDAIELSFDIKFKKCNY